MTTTRTRSTSPPAPSGWPTPDDFRLVEVELPDPGPGEVLVRNTFLSVDPYMRGRMNDVKSYVPPFASTPRWTAARSARSSPPNDDGAARRRHRAAPARLARARAAAGQRRPLRRRRRGAGLGLPRGARHARASRRTSA